MGDCISRKRKAVPPDGIDKGTPYARASKITRRDDDSTYNQRKKISKQETFPLHNSCEDNRTNILSRDDEIVNSKNRNDLENILEPSPKLEESNTEKTRIENPIKTVRDDCGIERKYFGIVNEEIPEKVIILLGASGSGKTTIVNFAGNYCYGKKSAEDQLIHVEPTSPTSTITAYTFCSSKKDTPITVIDTPGLNDSSVGEVREHVQSLKKFLVNANSSGLEIHAIGFVAQAHLVRLTSSERLVMDYVFTTFGQNVSENLVTLVTFADTQNAPPITEALRSYNVESKLLLKFNNSALSNRRADEVDDLDKVYFRVCSRNWTKFLKTLKNMPAIRVNAMQ